MTLIEVMVAVVITAALSAITMTVLINLQKEQLKEESLRSERERLDIVARKIEDLTRESNCILNHNLFFIHQDGSTTEISCIDSFLTFNQDTIGVFDTIYIETTGSMKKLVLNRSGRWRILSWY